MKIGEHEALHTKAVGVQIAAKAADEALAAIDVVLERCDIKNNGNGAAPTFIDMNCGCPIYEVAKKRGLGAALLRSPRKLEKLLTRIVEV